MKKYILGLSGSPRVNGNTSDLVGRVLEAFDDDVDTEIVNLGALSFKGCIGCEMCRETFQCVIKDDMQDIYRKILRADAIVIGTPTYFYNVTSLTKAFLERLYCYEIFHEEDRSVWTSLFDVTGRKPAVTLSICEQKDARDMGVTSKVLDDTLDALGFRVVESVKVLNLYERSASVKDAEARSQALRAGEKLKRTLELESAVAHKVRV